MTFTRTVYELGAYPCMIIPKLRQISEQIRFSVYYFISFHSLWSTIQTTIGILVFSCCHSRVAYWLVCYDDFTRMVSEWGIYPCMIVPKLRQMSELIRFSVYYFISFHSLWSTIQTTIGILVSSCCHSRVAYWLVCYDDFTRTVSEWGIYPCRIIPKLRQVSELIRFSVYYFISFHSLWSTIQTTIGILVSSCCHSCMAYWLVCYDDFTRMVSEWGIYPCMIIPKLRQKS
jgi:hypothetical protein